MTMTDWIYMLKTVFKSRYTKKELRDIIVSDCLDSPLRIYGSYSINHQKVWDNIVEKDINLKKQLFEKRITDYAGIIGYYEEIQYKNMRATYPRKRHKH